MQQIPKPSLGLGSWLRLGLMIVLGVAILITALFVAGFLLIIGLIGAALFSGWVAMKGRRKKGPKIVSQHEAHHHKAQARQKGTFIQGKAEPVDDSSP